ncbi:MAG: hypothetical protein DMH00_03625 [Acidobacteria bacterium]|nr:MAG: hypothetical protein DMH00_03625 [Acidobacteriota bacterium]
MVPLLVLQTLPQPSVFSPNNALVTLSKRLDRSRFAMIVSVPREGLLTQALREVGTPVYRVPGLRTFRRHDALWRFPVVAIRLARLARRVRARLVVSNHAELGPFADAVARLNRLPWICFLRQADRPPRYYEKYRVARADAVVGVSEAALSAYRAYLKERRLVGNPQRVIHTGIDVPKLDLRRRSAPGERSIGSEKHSPVIGTVGLRGVKRPELLLEILSKIRHRTPAIRCIFIGGAEPQELARLRALAERLGVSDSVNFPGQQREMDTWYEAMNVYAHTSRSEGLPKVVLEAMAHALPVVAFRVGGIAEAVAEDETGFLCPEGDLNAFAGAMEHLLTDGVLARRMGEAGRIRIEHHFSARAMGQDMMALFDDVLREHDNRRSVSPLKTRQSPGSDERTE